MASETVYRSFECPLHFGIGYSLDCLGCRGMPTIMADGTTRESHYTITTPQLRRWSDERNRYRAPNSTVAHNVPE